MLGKPVIINIPPNTPKAGSSFVSRVMGVAVAVVEAVFVEEVCVLLVDDACVCVDVALPVAEFPVVSEPEEAAAARLTCARHERMKRRTTVK